MTALSVFSFFCAGVSTYGRVSFFLGPPGPEAVDVFPEDGAAAGRRAEGPGFGAEDAGDGQPKATWSADGCRPWGVDADDDGVGRAVCDAVDEVDGVVAVVAEFV